MKSMFWVFLLFFVAMGWATGAHASYVNNTMDFVGGQLQDLYAEEQRGRSVASENTERFWSTLREREIRLAQSATTNNGSSGGKKDSASKVKEAPPASAVASKPAPPQQQLSPPVAAYSTKSEFDSIEQFWSQIKGSGNQSDQTSAQTSATKAAPLGGEDSASKSKNSSIPVAATKALSLKTNEDANNKLPPREQPYSHKNNQDFSLHKAVQPNSARSGVQTEKLNERLTNLPARPYDQELFDQILRKSSDVNFYSQDLGITLDMLCLEKNFPLMEALVSAGAGVNFLHRVLVQACCENSIKLAAFLVFKGVDIDKKNSAGRTPLAAAISYKRIEMVEFCVGWGASVKDAIILIPDTWGLEQLLRPVSEDRKVLELGALCRLGDMKTVAYLIRQGANVNKESEGCTPLAAAMLQKNADMAGMLVACGANIHQKCGALADKVKGKYTPPKSPVEWLTALLSSWKLSDVTARALTRALGMKQDEAQWRVQKSYSMSSHESDDGRLDMSNYGKSNHYGWMSYY